MLKMLCNNNDIVNDTMKPFRINTEKGVLVRKINERLFVCDNYCPHKGALFSKGKLKPNENRIICHMHYFEYNLFTDKLEENPDIWKKQSTGWKKSGDLKVYKAFEDNSGNVFVEMP
jgi:nitrite reductase/ring-hydroxylating ferredoxin subunit